MQEKPPLDNLISSCLNTTFGKILMSNIMDCVKIGREFPDQWMIAILSQILLPISKTMSKECHK
jgi:hypothetical protein